MQKNFFFMEASYEDNILIYINKMSPGGKMYFQNSKNPEKLLETVKRLIDEKAISLKEFAISNDYTYLKRYK